MTVIDFIGFVINNSNELLFHPIPTRHLRLHHLCRRTGNDRILLDETLVYRSIGADTDIIRYLDVTEDDGTGSDIHIVANARGLVVVSTDIHSNVNAAVLANRRMRVDDDVAPVRKRQPGAKDIDGDGIAQFYGNPSESMLG